MTDTSALEPAEYLRRLFDDVEFSYLVVVAAQLGIADLLESGPRSVADLSAATGADGRRQLTSASDASYAGPLPGGRVRSDHGPS
jgi:hypothetical protein